MQPGWCQPVRQEFMENECEALPGVAYPGVRDNRSTINTKTGYDDDDMCKIFAKIVCNSNHSKLQINPPGLYSVQLDVGSQTSAQLISQQL